MSPCRDCVCRLATSFDGSGETTVACARSGAGRIRAWPASGLQVMTLAVTTTDTGSSQTAVFPGAVVPPCNLPVWIWLNGFHCHAVLAPAGNHACGAHKRQYRAKRFTIALDFTANPQHLYESFTRSFGLSHSILMRGRGIQHKTKPAGATSYRIFFTFHSAWPGSRLPLWQCVRLIGRGL